MTTTTTWLAVLCLAACAWADPCKSGSGIEASLVWKRLCELHTQKNVNAGAMIANGTSSTELKKLAVRTTTVRPRLVATTVRPKTLHRVTLMTTTTTQRPKIVLKNKEGVKNRAKQLPKDKRVPLVNIKLLKDSATAASTEVEASSSSGGGRQHKAFFVNYPAAAQRGYQDKGVKPMTKKKPRPGKKRPRPDSDIYYIKLPPTPYNYVPGLGYISQPPTFSTSHLAGPRPQRPVQNPFIKLPIDFVSNGKPTAVYRYPSKDQTKKPQYHKHKLDSPVIRLNRGPYYFNGKPVSMYVMEKEARPTGHNRF